MKKMLLALLLEAGLAQTASPAVVTAGAPALGGHGIGVQFMRAGESSVSTSPFTSANGSLIIASVGRGVLADHALATVSDNKGNGAYTRIGSAHRYTHWPESGTVLFQKANISGGSGHAVIASKPSANDEVTIMAAEFTGVTTVVDAKWTEDLMWPYYSASVTTTGPAILVSFWWGDDVNGEMNPGISDGWTVIEHTSSLASNHVQGAMAYRIVSSAGSYRVRWKPGTWQGAQIYLLALQ